MDIVTDLTAQSVAYLTVLQDICKTESKVSDLSKIQSSDLWDLLEDVDIKNLSSECVEKQEEAITDLIWCSHGQQENADIFGCFDHISSDLLGWLKTNLPKDNSGSADFRAARSRSAKLGMAHHRSAKSGDEDMTIGNALNTPYQWRVAIRAILYQKPKERIILAQKLNYVPVQIIFCIAGNGLDPYIQRLLQAWNKENSSNLFTNADNKYKNEWWDTPRPILLIYNDDKNKRLDGSRRQFAQQLLADDEKLLAALNEAKVAVPFETLFNQELDEIYKSRQKRFEDSTGSLSKNADGEPLPVGHNEDPLQRATNMKLYGLAFSGGGIRSATFNLGVLQKLAEKNWLPRIDYLSTVSGGGYIGTWYASWIKRGGSVEKIADRLDHRKSSDPLGEEVRPVRWLRMFSNYLAPDSSLMSTDSWTMGITWLRNTLINQFILLLLLCATLEFIKVSFEVWNLLKGITNAYLNLQVAGWSALIMLPGALMAGIGMRVYDRQPVPKRSEKINSLASKVKEKVNDNSFFSWLSRTLFNAGRNPYLPNFLLYWVVLSSFFVSAWFCNTHVATDFMGSVWMLKTTAIVGFTGMLVIAYMGYYRRCCERVREKKYADFAIWGSSLLASLVGLLLLAALWQLLANISKMNDPIYPGHRYVVHYMHRKLSFFLSQNQVTYREFGLKLAFIIGTPLVIEAIACCVVIRMALMGRLFPDERREWWGRMGAKVHRISFLWLLISAGALLLPAEFEKITKQMHNINLPALFGGWAAIIGGTVKLAFQSKGDGTKVTGTSSRITDIIVRVAPYIFLLGFLLLGAYSLQYISLLVPHIRFDGYQQNNLLASFIITAALALITIGLSWRVGVNEFSLHHFYRNRLVRAYLGATRSRTSRDKTANSFTGFDKDDDIKLSEFITDNEYYGPYPILNAALNSTVVSQLDRQDRKAESFIFSPLYSGFDFSLTRSAASAKSQAYEYGYRPTNQYAYENGPKIGTAMAISGAAVNPNMGYHSSAATAFMLTIFNVRLGWWMGNPRKDSYDRSDPKYGLIYLVNDLIGKSDIDSDFVCLSDGGHFDNMGLYELVRRKCHYIILGDGEEDESAVCEGLANAIRRCRIDFGVEIDVNTKKITNKDENTGFGIAHVVKGDIWYPGEKAPGILIYIKTALTGDESTDVREYHLNNDQFPQQSTGDQFFTEEQFESYRELGYHSVETSDLF